jgi:Big-like domain-containing protein
MSAMRIFCVAISALLLTGCTNKQGGLDWCGFAQIINMMSFGGFEDFKQDVCHPKPTETAAANAPSPSPKPSPSQTQTAAATPASPSDDPNSNAQLPAGSTPPPDTSSTPATPTTTAVANPCTTTCPVGSFCEVQTAQSGLGPPPDAEAAKMAALGPPPEEQAAAPMAGLGPPPQEQAATPMAGLGPPPDSPAAPAPVGPSSPGTAAVPIPPVVPMPLSPPAPQPPTANSGNVCSPTPPASPKPGNVCSPTPASKPNNVCTSSTPSTAGNSAQQPPPTARVNSGECHTVNGQTTCTDASGNSCTTTGGFCDPTAPQSTKTAAAPAPPTPNAGPLTLKPSTQMASAGNPCNQKSQNASVPACSSKPPYLPWGGHGSATITVSDGQPCGVGWHDTPGGPGGVTVLDSMSVSSPPSHGTLRPQDQHVIIFTPAPNYKGQDTFTLTMREHNGGRSATLSVTVSVTIQ